MVVERVATLIPMQLRSLSRPSTDNIMVERERELALGESEVAWGLE